MDESTLGADAGCSDVVHLQPSVEDNNYVKLWLMPQGTVLCMDQRFADWFGKGPAECVGRAVNNLFIEQVGTVDVTLDA